jgi:hypothetical protein
MAKSAKPKVSKRPQFRPGTLMCHALHLYNTDTEHNNSQTMRMALKRFIPQRYFEQASKEISKRGVALA